VRGYYFLLKGKTAFIADTHTFLSLSLSLFKLIDTRTHARTSSRPGVLKWHFAGRMRPVNMFYAARDKDQNKKMSKNDKESLKKRKKKKKIDALFSKEYG